MDNKNLITYPSSMMYLIILLIAFSACTDDTAISSNSAGMTVEGGTDIISEECMLPTYDAPAVSGGIPIEELITQASTAICLKLSECCAQDVLHYLNELSNETPLTAFTDEACQERISTMFNQFNLTRWIELAQAGKVEYHGEAAQEYITQLGQLTCDQMVTNRYALELEIKSITNAQLKQTFQYQTSCLGGPCTQFDNQSSCDPNTSFCCIPQDNPDDRCERPGPGEAGQCVALLERGESCFSTLECQEGLECDGVEEYTCMEPVVYDVYPLGAACGADLSYYGSCEQGTYCDKSGQCVAPKEAGEACESSDRCMAMTYCDGSVCVAQKGEGEACVSSAECINSCVEQTCRALCLD